MKPRVFQPVLLFFAAIAAAACLRPGEERAERDLEVGHASAAGLRVDVAAGLAAIRELGAGRLRLWGSAPTLQVTLERDLDAPQTWQLEVENCLFDAELIAPASVGVQQLDRALPTECAWQLELPPSEPVVLRIRSARDGQTGAFRFALMSDVQSAVDEVQDVFSRMNQDADLVFVLSTGDTTQQGTGEQLRRFQAELKTLSIPFFTTLGNHELSFSEPRFHDHFGRGSFHFSFAGVDFTLLDSASATLDPLVYDWLDGWLADSRERVHIVAMHIAPLDPAGLRGGGFASRSEAAMLLGKLADAGVDLTLYGHIHSYYAFHNAGIPAYISGGGGALPERFDGIGRHYLSVEVDREGGVLGVQVVRVD